MFGINEILSNVVKFVNELSGGNQMIGGAISLWLLGTITYFCKSVPMNIYYFAIKHLTTTMTISNYHVSFFKILEWLEDEGYAHKFRKINLTNGHYGHDDEKTTKSVGYGSHIIWVGWQPIQITLDKEQAQATDRPKETITLKRIGRSHKVFDKLLNIVKERLQDDDNKDVTDIYHYDKRDSDWCYSGKQPKRPLESVIIHKTNKEQLLHIFDKFFKKEQWYIDNGIPYQLGILLHGPPGTGKTSIIKALAGHYNKRMYVANMSAFADLEQVLSDCNEKSIVVLEDIDSYSGTKKRKSDDEEANDSSISETMADIISNGSISGILNAIDGVVAKHGRIMIMTTNHIQKLDPALIRPGRVDLALKIDYIDDEMFKEFIKRFYNSCDLEKLSLYKLKNDLKLTGATLQQDIITETSLDEILEKYTDKINCLDQSKENK